MRLELALIVGILFFCSWCAYIVARMSSSVNAPLAGPVRAGPHLQPPIQQASNEQALQTQVLEQQQLDQQQQQQQLNLINQTNSSGVASVRPTLIDQAQVVTVAGQDQQLRAGRQSETSEPLARLYQLAWPPPYATNGAQLQAPNFYQASTYAALASPQKQAQQHLQMQQPQQPQQWQHYALPTSSDQQQQQFVQEPQELTDDAQGEEEHQEQADDQPEQQRDEAATSEQLTNVNDEADYQHPAGQEEEDDEHQANGGPPPQSELEEVSNQRSFRELQSDSNERDPSGRLIVTRRRHLINGQPVANGRVQEEPNGVDDDDDEDEDADHEAAPSGRSLDRPTPSPPGVGLATAAGEPQNAATELDFAQLVQEIDQEDRLRKQQERKQSSGRQKQETATLNNQVPVKSASTYKAANKNASKTTTSKQLTTRPQLANHRLAHVTGPELGRRTGVAPLSRGAQIQTGELRVEPTQRRRRWRKPIAEDKPTTKQGNNKESKNSNKTDNKNDSHRHSLKETLTAQQWDDDSSTSLDGPAKAAEEEELRDDEDQEQVGNIVERDEEARRLEAMARELLPSPSAVSDELDGVDELEELEEHRRRKRQTEASSSSDDEEPENELEEDKQHDLEDSSNEDAVESTNSDTPNPLNSLDARRRQQLGGFSQLGRASFSPPASSSSDRPASSISESNATLPVSVSPASSLPPPAPPSSDKRTNFAASRQQAPATKTASNQKEASANESQHGATTSVPSYVPLEQSLNDRLMLAANHGAKSATGQTGGLRAESSLSSLNYGPNKEELNWTLASPLNDLTTGSEDMHVEVLARPPVQMQLGLPVQPPVVYTPTVAGPPPGVNAPAGHPNHRPGSVQVASGSHKVAKRKKKSKKMKKKKMSRKHKSRVMGSKYQAAAAYANKQKRHMEKGDMKRRRRKSEKRLISDKKHFEGLTKGKKLGHGHKVHGAKKGAHYLKDKGYKKRGFKKSYHKLETGDHKTYFDEFRDKDRAKKWKNFDDKHMYSQKKKWAGYDSKRRNHHDLKLAKGHASKAGKWREKSAMKHAKEAERYRKSKKLASKSHAVKPAKKRRKKKKVESEH